MILYHGTNAEFEFIDLGKCPVTRDFGRGFYTTKIKEHAERRAQDKVRTEGGKPSVLEFNYNMAEAKAAYPLLRIKHFENISEEWALFIMHNRMRGENEPEHDYDIVEGPVANDKMFQQFRLYKTNRIGLASFVKSLAYSRESTHQVAFCTERAIEWLIDYNQPPRFKVEEITVKLIMVLIEKQDFTDMKAQETVYHSATFSRLADFSTKLYRKTWQEIYEQLKQELKRK
jgi:hypothetical protein